MVGLLISLLRVASFVFLLRALASWFRPSPGSALYPVVDGLFRITDPVLKPIRRILPPMGGLDLSVVVVLLVINVALIPMLRGLL